MSSVMAVAYIQNLLFDNVPKAVDVDRKWIVNHKIPTIVELWYRSVTSVRMRLRRMGIIGRVSAGHPKINYVILWRFRCAGTWFFDFFSERRAHM